MNRAERRENAKPAGRRQCATPDLPAIVAKIAHADKQRYRATHPQAPAGWNAVGFRHTCPAMPNIAVIPAIDHHRVDDPDFIAFCAAGKIPTPTKDVGPRYHLSIETHLATVSNVDAHAIVASFCPWAKSVSCRVQKMSDGSNIVHMFIAPRYPEYEPGDMVVLDGID